MSTVIIGAGTGLYQILDIIYGRPFPFDIVAVVDRDVSLQDTLIQGSIPVIGGQDALAQWFKRYPDDRAVISIGDPGPRKEWREYCYSIGMALESVTDESLHRGVNSQIGPGCLISANCHIGTYAKVGHNCKLSPYCSIEHHSEVGDDCTFGPGVITSGNVKIGSRCKFGTGIFIEPRLTIGDDCIIASGAIITMSVPSGHIVRTKINTSMAEIQKSC